MTASVNSLFAHDFMVDGIYYNITSDASCEVTSNNGLENSYSGSVVIPENVDFEGKTYNVTSIDDWAFSGSENLSSITIGRNVEYVGDGSFVDCYGLKEVHTTDLSAWCGIEFNNSPNPTFYSNNLYLNDELIKDLVIPDDVTAIGFTAFTYCKNLETVTIPDNVTTIGESAFISCSGLKSVSMGRNVEYVDYNAFYDCTGLVEVYISDLHGWLNIEFENEISNPLFLGADLYLNGNLVANLAIPDDVAAVKDYAFYGCTSLETVDVSDSVTEIGDGAFSYCSGLESIDISESVESIGSKVFVGCNSLTSITVSPENSIYSSYDGLLCNKDQTKLICSAPGRTSVNMPATVTVIGEFAFYGCTNLASVKIPDSVVTIGESAFHGCTGLTSLTIPDYVKTIEDNAFNGCNFSTVTVGSSVEYIGRFSLLVDFSTCYMKPTVPPSCFDSSFLGTFLGFQDHDCVLYVPTGCKEAYRKADEWSKFPTILETDFSGVGDVAVGGVDVSVENGCIVVRGAEGAVAEIYNLAGRLVYSGIDASVGNLSKGVYIVRVAGRAFKVAL